MRRLRSSGIVAVLVVLDLLVIALAWYRTERPAHASAPSASAAASALASAETSITGPVLLAASPAGSLLRVTRGSCDAREPVRADVWVAASKGAPVRGVRVEGLQESLGVRADDGRLTVVGADAKCRVRGWTSTDAGASWTRGAVPSNVWYLDTDTTLAAVHGPVSGGVENLDCVPVSVSTVGDGSQALVSCSGSNLLGIAADPAVAPVSYVVTSPVGAVAPEGGMPLALAELPTCTASLERVVSQQDARQITCLSQDDAPLALALSGNRVYAQVGARLLVTDDLRRRFRVY